MALLVWTGKGNEVTTNVIDLNAKVVASDSRWSYVQDDKMHYVDDTSFDKIAVCDDAVMVCAGDAELIGVWKEWLNKDQFYNVQTPPTELDRNGEIVSVYVSLITRPEGELLYSKGVYLFVDGMFMFAGSGGTHACDCFTTNKDVEMCIETAKKQDICTGGQVRKIDVVTGKSNLADPQLGVDDIQASYSQRGNTMDLVKSTKQSAAPGGSASNDQQVQGEKLFFTAPTGPLESRWTQEDHVRLGKALQKLSDRAAKRDNK